MTSPGVAFRGTAIGLISCAVLVAFLNLYMNFVASRNSSAFQIDLSADGDVLGFHQFEFPAAGGHSSNGRRRVRLHSAAKAQNPDIPSCMGLCPTSGSLFTQVNYVKTLVHARMKNLAKNAFRVDLDIDLESKQGPKIKSRPSFNSSYFSEIWRQSSKWVWPRRISAPDDVDHAKLMDALSTARLLRVSMPTKGTQLKIMVLLEGGQWAVWKPKFLERTDVVEGGPTDGPDRHNGEIAAFYIGKLLGLNRTPFVVGRVFSLKSELVEVTDSTLRDTFFTHNRTSRLCFYGQCVFCSPSLPVCADEEDQLEGALIQWFPPAFSNLTRIRSPWARTYDPHRLAPWQTNVTFCRNVVDHELFGQPPIFLDLMDTAVFDFLIGNADRHRVEYFKDQSPTAIVLLDNGKSFGNPNLDELTILAPLYQCCRIRQRLYQVMVRYSEMNFGALLNDQYLKNDPLYPILTSQHLEAVNRRLRIVLALVESCIEQHGQHSVLVNDEY